MNAHARRGAHGRPPLAAILLVPVIAALVLILFAWPSARLEPRDLPIGVAGPPAQARAIEQRLTADAGAFDVRRYPDAAAARRALEEREIYGAAVATPAGGLVLTASAASPMVAQLLTHAAATGGAGGEGAAVPVLDVVPAGPRGTALASAVLPLAIAGILCGVVASLLASAPARRAALIAGAAVLVGLASTAIVQGWLDIIQGEWWANAAVLSLTVLAVAATVAGLSALLGELGMVLGALTMVLIGNPFSGAATAPELLPEPVGAVGQLLPLGAGANLLRSTSFFDGAAAGGPVLVLAAWSLAGLAALAVARRRTLPAAAPAAA